MENIGLGYFDSIQITDPEQWRDRLPEYLIEREKYDRWVAMYGTDTFINVVFHNDYCSGRNLVGVAYHLMEMVTKLKKGNLDINPFLRKNGEFGSRHLPGICIYNQPETTITFLHSYISGAFMSSKLAEHCSMDIPFFELMNRSIYDDMGAGVITRFDELDNNDGILLIDFVSKKYAFVMTDTFDPSNAMVPLQKFVPLASDIYMRAFHPENSFATAVNYMEGGKNARLNKKFNRAMKDFDLLSSEDVLEWFPEMQERIPVQARFRPKGLKTPPVFEDAQVMETHFPGTFTAPTQDMLARITVGIFVKVCAKIPQHILAQRVALGLPGFVSERFWVQVTATDGLKITGVINNRTQHVELNEGDEVSFEQRHVYQIQ
jgi:hypothetical protein